MTLTPAFLSELRAAAEAVGSETWTYQKSCGDHFVTRGDGDAVASFTHCYPECAISLDEKDATFIAKANPATVLALLDEVITLRAVVEAQSLEWSEFHLFFQGWDADECGALEGVYSDIVQRVQQNAFAMHEIVSEEKAR